MLLGILVDMETDRSKGTRIELQAASEMLDFDYVVVILMSNIFNHSSKNQVHYLKIFLKEIAVKY